MQRETTSGQPRPCQTPNSIQVKGGGRQGPRRARGSSKTKGVRQRREGTSTLKRVAHCGRTLCKPRTASHLVAAVFAVRVDPAHSAVAAKHSGRCPKRTALAPRRRPAPRELCECGIGRAIPTRRQAPSIVVCTRPCSPTNSKCAPGCGHGTSGGGGWSAAARPSFARECRLVRG